MKRARPAPWRWLVLALCCGLLPALGWHYAKNDTPGHRQPVRLALPTQLAGTTALVALDKGMFARAGLDVSLSRHMLGAQALKEVLEDRADLAVVAETPVMFGIMKGDPIVILGSLRNSRDSAAILARKDHGVSAIADLAGKTLGMVAGSNMHYFSEVMLLSHRVRPGSVKLLDLKADEIVPALESGRVDAVATWQPNLMLLERTIPAGTARFSGEELFSQRFLLVARRDYVAGHGEQVQAVMTALVDATRALHEHPDDARRIAAALGLDPATLTKLVDLGDFQVRLDEAMIMALEDQTRWALRGGLVKGKVPNYLDYLHLDALTAAAPRAVTVIH